MENKSDPNKKSKSHNTVSNYAFGIKKWLELNGVKVNWEQITFPTRSATVEVDRAPTKEELKTIITKSLSSLDKAVVYCDSASGLRINNLLSLTVGDVDFNFPDVANV